LPLPYTVTYHNALSVSRLHTKLLCMYTVCTSNFSINIPSEHQVALYVYRLHITLLYTYTVCTSNCSIRIPSAYQIALYLYRLYIKLLYTYTPTHQIALYVYPYTSNCSIRIPSAHQIALYVYRQHIKLLYTYTVCTSNLFTYNFFYLYYICHFIVQFTFYISHPKIL
jgi:hypothetical protein